MAKRGPSIKSLSKGMTVNKILAMDYDAFDNLNEIQLRAAVRVMVSAANKRLSAMEKKNERSPAYRAVQKSMGVEHGGRFSVKGKSFSEMRTEFTQLTGFLTHKTSTLTGWKEVKKQTIKALEEKADIFLEPEQWDRFFETFDKLEDLDSNVNLRSLKYDVMQLISDAIDDDSKSPDDIALELQDDVKDAYERNESLQDAFESGGVSALFESQ